MFTTVYNWYLGQIHCNLCIHQYFGSITCCLVLFDICNWYLGNQIALSHVSGYRDIATWTLKSTPDALKCKEILTLCVQLCCSYCPSCSLIALRWSTVAVLILHQASLPPNLCWICVQHKFQSTFCQTHAEACWHYMSCFSEFRQILMSPHNGRDCPWSNQSNLKWLLTFLFQPNTTSLFNCQCGRQMDVGSISVWGTHVRPRLTNLVWLKQQATEDLQSEEEKVSLLTKEKTKLQVQAEDVRSCSVFPLHIIHNMMHISNSTINVVVFPEIIPGTCRRCQVSMWHRLLLETSLLFYTQHFD